MKIAVNNKLDRIALNRPIVRRPILREQRALSVHVLRRPSMDFQKIRSILKIPTDKPKRICARRKTVTICLPNQNDSSIDTVSVAPNDPLTSSVSVTNQNQNDNALNDDGIQLVQYDSEPSLSSWVDSPMESVLIVSTENDAPLTSSVLVANQNQNDDDLIDFMNDDIEPAQYDPEPSTLSLIDSPMESVAPENDVPENDAPSSDSMLIDVSVDWSQPIQSSRAHLALNYFMIPTILHANVASTATGSQNNIRSEGLANKSSLAEGNLGTSSEHVGEVSASSDIVMKSTVAGMVSIFVNQGNLKCVI